LGLKFPEFRFEFLNHDNFFFQAGPRAERRRPISLLVKETELKLYVGEPFRDFTPFAISFTATACRKVVT
jgi:hypothetical protein